MTGPETGLMVAFWVLVAVAVAVRLGPALRRRQPLAVPPYACFTPPPPGARWLPCETTTCARLSILHTQQPDGTYRCTSCGNTKGDQ